MIFGIGCDIINIKRIEKSDVFLKRFAQKILNDEEKKENLLNNDMRHNACTLAKYYAGKEAFVKALGTGFRDGIYLRDICITHDTLGKPELKIYGNAVKYLSKAPNYKMHISLSDDYPYAQAIVVIETD